MGELFNISSAILFSISSGSILVFSLSSWLGKVWASRILESERSRYSEMLENLKHQLDFQLHSSKTVFDAEFQIYRDLWDAANNLRNLAINIRPWHGQENMTQDQITSNYKYLQQAIASFDLFVNNHKPFFAPEIYSSLICMQNAVSLENKKAVVSNSLEGINYCIDHMDSINPILEASDELCQLIRERLYSNSISKNQFNPTKPDVAV